MRLRRGWWRYRSCPSTADIVVDRGSEAAERTTGTRCRLIFDIDRAFGPDDGPDSTALMGGFPPLVDAADRAGQRQPEMSARAYLAESINEPNAFIPPTFAGGNGPTTAMPQLTVTSEEVDALIDHLLSK